MCPVHDIRPEVDTQPLLLNPKYNNSAPLNKLLTQNEQLVWASDEENAFQPSKELLQSSDVLVHCDQEKELILSCDASPYGIGVVLAHRMEYGSERSISFASRTLAPGRETVLAIGERSIVGSVGRKEVPFILVWKTFCDQQ